MPQNNAPFGLRPVKSLNGPRNARAYDGVIASAYGTSIFQNTPVKLNAGGTLVPCTAVGDAILGVFEGVENYDTSGRRRQSNFWQGGQVIGTGVQPMRVFIWEAGDDVEFEVQLNGTAPANINALSLNMLAADLSPPAGDPTTGLSSARGDNVAIASGTAGQLQVLGVGYEVDNGAADPYVIVRVKVSRPQRGAPIVAI